MQLQLDAGGVGAIPSSFWVATFCSSADRSNLLPPSSRLKSKPNKESVLLASSLVYSPL
jgi:hypothetical protein